MGYTIAIVGSGVVGAASGKVFNEMGHLVYFIDIQDDVVAQLREQGYPAFSPSDQLPTTPDIVFICTNTPASPKGPDISSIIEATQYITSYLSKERYTLLVTRSTTPVGTSERLAELILEKRPDLVRGEDFDTCSNPEYLREKTAVQDMQSPRSIVIGVSNERSSLMLTNLYKPLNTPIHTLTPQEAEMHKYTHNLFNASKIAFFNEQRRVCEKAQINADVIFPLVVETAEASWNPTYGIRDLGAFDGHCLPKDTEGFFNWAQNEHSLELTLLKAIIDANKKYLLETQNGTK